jgi:murein DD-endopeptidase
MRVLSVELPVRRKRSAFVVVILKGALLLTLLYGMVSTITHAQAATLVKKSPASAKKKSLSIAARQRIHNRNVLLQKTSKVNAKSVEGNHSANFPQRSSVQEQRSIQEQASIQKRASAQNRARNRQLLRINAQWFFPALNAEEVDIADTNLMSGEANYLQRITQTVLERLLQQLGKPYVWGGESPLSGFDCSGLVYYAYNPLLTVKLPRTVNEMYRFKQGLRVTKAQLRRGDLIFFAIKSQKEADHVGVYLGKGKFIEAPRTGKDIRISYLNDDFWLDRYLGARRMITANTIL